MKGKITKLIVLAGVAPTLVACQAFHPRHQARTVATTPAQPENFGASYLAEGRKALDRGEITAAVTAFRNAKLYPQHEAAAFNGLAVAYDRLGREDLTERFFRQAVALAPDEPRFRMNLARFYGRNPVVPLEVLGATGPGPSPDAGAGTSFALRQEALRSSAGIRVSEHVVAQAPRSRLVRISANEVRLGGDGTDAAKVGARGNPAYPVRIGLSLGTPSVRVSAYPVQIRLAD